VNFEKIKSQFPVFSSNPDLIYLDSGASAQKPECVIKATADFYADSYSNVHRGVYDLSVKSTELYDQSRKTVAKFLNTKKTSEIIFTRGTTEAINLVAYSWGDQELSSGDEILSTILEHHSNFVPWQLLAKKKNLSHKMIPLNEDLTFCLDKFRKSFTPKTKLVCVTHLSNGAGVELPIKEIVKISHEFGAKVLVDAAQSVSHAEIDVQDLDVDFLAFSGHKLYGPTGIGCLFAKQELLEKMSPYQSGGDMISKVTLAETTFNVPPYKFEAGTPNIAGAIALKVAIDFVTEIGFEAISSHEQKLVSILETELAKIPGVSVIGPKVGHKALVCFVVDSVHPHDLAQFLNSEKIAIRAGHHCNQTLLEHLNLPASVRASVGIYNNEQDVRSLVEALRKAISYFTK
jgi:cysteine desulfurase/selenocysteine lyase